jgi:hypothetical protein
VSWQCSTGDVELATYQSRFLQSHKVDVDGAVWQIGLSKKEISTQQNKKSQLDKITDQTVFDKGAYTTSCSLRSRL